MSYDFHSIEQRWQKYWDERDIYHASDESDKEKYYSLVMFPYPSGDAHIGHWYNYVGADFYTRYKRMKGFNVLNPFGFDAFGLPAENAAIKRGLHPSVWTQQNISTMISQYKQMGASFDWDRLVNTSDPEYYRWTQWIFLQLYKRGLAYRAPAKVNWCETDQTVLANEQVENGLCWRCGNPVVQKELEQWFFKITDYAEELLSDLERLDWPDKTRVMQENWIGRSEGLEVDFKLVDDGSEEAIRVFTTKPETIYGVTYLVVAPDHSLVDQLVTEDQRTEVEAYLTEISKLSERERLSDEKKTGVFTGSFVRHPLTHEDIPVWIGNYVLSTYATGAVMGVPAHDARDWEFASEYGLPKVFIMEHKDENSPFYFDDGKLIASSQFDGLTATEAKTSISDLLVADYGAKKVTTYRLRDWLVSRQRYWGAPIPMISCQKCGFVPVPEKDLPVLLPEDVDFSPKGQAPLATNKEFMTVECPVCHGAAQRVAETMDTFVDSSWYFLRYASPHDTAEAFNKEKVKQWLPVDLYVGGAEHTVLHLLYSRFFVKALRDMGYLEFDEPFMRLIHQGMILGPDHQKMSKSKGNVVNPDDLVQDFGVDSVRMQLGFIGPFEQGGPWQLSGIHGVHRFLQKVWKLHQSLKEQGWPADSSDAVLRQLQETIERVGVDIENFRNNTAIASLMTCLNTMAKEKTVSKQSWLDFVKLLAPFAPHLSEEIWHSMGMDDSVHTSAWPDLMDYEGVELGQEAVSIAVQVNGKLRGVLQAASDLSEEEVLAKAQQIETVTKHISDKEVIKIIFVPNKIINLVVR